MTFRRLLSRFFLAAEGKEPRSPTRYVPGPSRDGWRRFHDALWRADYGTAIECLEEQGIVVFQRYGSLVVQSPAGPVPEACKRLLTERQGPLLGALQRHAQAQGTDGRTRLHQAWALNDGAARLLLFNGAARNPQDDLGRTPLHEATTHRNLPVVEALLQAGADVAMADAGGRTPLHAAAEDGQDAVARAMVAEHHGAVNLRDGSGRAALHLAAQAGRAAVARALVDAQAEVDAVTPQGETALALAVSRGHAATVRVLLLAGADPEARDIRPSPLAAALQARRTTIAALLVQHGARVAALESELLAASLECGDMELLERTLDDKVPGSLENNRFLCEAVERNLSQAVGLLLKAGAVAECQDNRPLKMAVYGGHHDIAALLKQAGAPVEPAVQTYELTLQEKPFRFQLNLVDEAIVQTEYLSDDGWQLVES